MKMLIAAAAVGALVLSPLVAASGDAEAKVVKASKTHVVKHRVTHMRTIRAVRAPGYIRAVHAPGYGWAPAPGPFSSQVHRPEYDVYVRGSVIGSDPDPRVRIQLRREYCEDSVDGC
jgi:hypothetical protein